MVLGGRRLGAPQRCLSLRQSPQWLRIGLNLIKGFLGFGTSSPTKEAELVEAVQNRSASSSSIFTMSEGSRFIKASVFELHNFLKDHDRSRLLRNHLLGLASVRLTVTDYQ